MPVSQQAGDLTAEAARITADLSVDEVMKVWPQTICVFLRLHLACIGCAVGGLHTVGDVARIYDIPLDVLLEELRAAALEMQPDDSESVIIPPPRSGPAREDRER